MQGPGSSPALQLASARVDVELEDGRVGVRRRRREPKVERPSDAAEEPQVRGVLKSAQVPCKAREANASNETPEYRAFGHFWALTRRVSAQKRSSECDWRSVFICCHR